MRCVRCGLENPEGFKFCGGCSQALRTASICPRCGSESPPGFKFCGQCASPLGALPPSEERSPGCYTPKHLAEKILTARSVLEGERKQVTVLFADVKGSLELAEELGAEPRHELLDRFFGLLTDGVHRFEGTVNQYTGDGIMALFGAPIAHEDHAQRACFAALALRDALRDLAREVKRAHGVDFATRIGLNSGEVVVGKIGDDLRVDYTAQGHTVGLAQRMETLASSGSIYLSAHTAELAQGYFALELRLALNFEYMGDVPGYRRALEAANAHELAVMEAASPLLGYDAPAFAMGCLGVAAYHEGRLEEAVAGLDRGIERARACAATEVVGWLLSDGANLWIDSGDCSRAARMVRESLEIAERIESPLSRAIATHAFSRVLAEEGDLDAAVAMAEQSVEAATPATLPGCRGR